MSLAAVWRTWRAAVCADGIRKYGNEGGMRDWGCLSFSCLVLVVAASLRSARGLVRSVLRTFTESGVALATQEFKDHLP